MRLAKGWSVAPLRSSIVVDLALSKVRANVAFAENPDHNPDTGTLVAG